MCIAVQLSAIEVPGGSIAGSVVGVLFAAIVVAVIIVLIIRSDFSSQDEQRCMYRPMNGNILNHCFSSLTECPLEFTSHETNKCLTFLTYLTWSIQTFLTYLTWSIQIFLTYLTWSIHTAYTAPNYILFQIFEQLIITFKSWLCSSISGFDKSWHHSTGILCIREV